MNLVFNFAINTGKIIASDANIEYWRIQATTLSANLESVIDAEFSEVVRSATGFAVIYAYPIFFIVNAPKF